MSRVTALFATVGALVVAAAVIVGVRATGDEEAACVGPARLAAYEWRTALWTDAVGYSNVLDELAAACASRIYIDVTGVGLADREETEQLADDVRELASLAMAQGVEIGAVAGDPWWPTTPDNPDVAEILGFVAELQAPAGPLVAFHFDTEPWGLDEWETDRTGLMLDFLDYIQYVEDLRDELGLDIPLGHLLPHWFDGSTDAVDSVEWNGDDGYPFEHIGAIVEQDTELVVMAYRNRADGDDGIVALASDELAAAGSETFPAVGIALEAGPVEPVTITFRGVPLDAFLREARRVVDATGVPEIVVNDAEGLVELPRNAS